MTLKSSRIQQFGPFTETPFVDELKANVINTETPTQNGEPNPDYCTLEVKDSLGLNVNKLDSVAINRAVVLGWKSEYNTEFEKGRIKSIVKELDKNGQLISPVCYINFGKGKILTSLVFLDYKKQNEKAKEWIVNLLCKLVLKEVKKKDGNTEQG